MRLDIAYVGTLSCHITCPAKSQAIKSIFRYLCQYKLIFFFFLNYFFFTWGTKVDYSKYIVPT